MKKFLNYYVIISVCLFAGVKLSNIDEGDLVVGHGFDLTTALLEIFVFGVLAAYVIASWSTFKSHLGYLKGPLPLVLLAGASTAWSISPQFTFNRSIVLLSATLFAYYLGIVFTPAELISLYRRALLWMLFLSIACVALLPSYGISHGVHSGAWRGAFYHKNRLGELMALVLVTFAIAPPKLLSNLRRWAIVLLAALLMFKAHSGTALGSVAMVILFQTLWPLLRLKRKTMTATILAGYPLIAIAGVIVFQNLSFFLGLLGRDTSFTGRDRLWAGILDAISIRPMLGYGYLAFWFQPLSGLVVVAAHLNWLAPQGHEGYLDLMLHLGIVGMVLYLWFFLRSVWLGLNEFRRTESSESRWFLSFMVFMAAYNVTESQILEPFYFLWVTLVAFSISFALQRRKSLGDQELELESELRDESKLVAV